MLHAAGDEEYLTGIIDDLSRLMTPLSDDFTVTHRGIGTLPEKLKAARVGEIYTEPGFWSSSKGAGVAENFSASTLVEISSPRGTRAVVANRLEAEVTLDAGTKYRVLDVIKREWSSEVPYETIYRLEVIPPAPL